MFTGLEGIESLQFLEVKRPRSFLPNVPTYTVSISASGMCWMVSRVWQFVEACDWEDSSPPRSLMQLCSGHGKGLGGIGGSEAL